MSATHFLGIDLGTTSTKAIVFSATGEMKGKGNYGYPIHTPHPAWAEQDPDVIFAAMLSAVRDAVQAAGVAPPEIAAVGLSAAMHSLVGVDAQGRPLTPHLIWADNRSISQTQQLKTSGVGHKLYLRTGTPIHPMSPLTKLVWFQENHPEQLQQIAKFLSIKEYIVYQLFEQNWVDYAIASATGLFNLEQLTWDAEALAVAGIRPDQLSQPVPTTQILRGMKPEYAAQMGLDPDTPVVMGASDGVLANLGIGAIAPGQVAITIGTSSAVRTVVPKPMTDPQGRTFCYAFTPDQWVIGGSSNSGGRVLQWFQQAFPAPEDRSGQTSEKDPYQALIAAAATIPAGSEGLLFLPFIGGERAPYWNADARGVFFGIGVHHHYPHFVRALLEGILFNIHAVLKTLQPLGVTPQEIRASGGFARSPLWRQMMADVLGYEVLVPSIYDSSSFGAAVLAMLGVGAIANLNSIQDLIQITERHHPHPQTTQVYQDLFPLCDRLYQHLESDFTALATSMNCKNSGLGSESLSG